MNETLDTWALLCIAEAMRKLGYTDTQIRAIFSTSDAYAKLLDIAMNDEPAPKKLHWQISNWPDEVKFSKP